MKCYKKRKRNETKSLSACSTTINLKVFTLNMVVNAALKLCDKLHVDL